jgi:uncharacterized UPF0146 family protein
MRVIITGTSHITDVGIVEKAVKASSFDVTEVVVSNQRGAEEFSEMYAARRGLPIRTCVPHVSKYHRASAVHCIRDMLEIADAMIYISTRVDPVAEAILPVAKRSKKPLFIYDATKKKPLNVNRRVSGGPRIKKTQLLE